METSHSFRKDSKMGRPRVIAITFDNPLRTYLNGQRVSGEVYIETDESIEIEGIVIVLTGQSRVKWNVKVQQDDKEGRTETEVAAKEEVYVRMENLLLSSNKLPRGQHSYQFAFFLPKNIPTSFQGKYGYVRYQVEVIIKRGVLNFNYNEVAPFTVNSILDLNLENGLNIPLEKTDSKFLCCCCCRSGPISAKVQIPRRGFVPGESILISGEIENKTSSSLAGSSAELIQTIVFKNSKETKTETIVLAKVDQGRIEGDQTDYWHDVSLLIPEVPPSRLDNCSIINIAYHIEFSVIPSGLSFDLDIILPITIGNVALRPNSMAKTVSATQGLLQTFNSLKLGLTNSNQAEIEYEAIGGSSDLKLQHDENGMLKPIYLNWKQKPEK